MKRTPLIQPLITFGIAMILSLATSQYASADMVSFLVDPDTIDSNTDGFITDDEFQPVGT